MNNNNNVGCYKGSFSWKADRPDNITKATYKHKIEKLREKKQHKNTEDQYHYYYYNNKTLTKQGGKR